MAGKALKEIDELGLDPVYFTPSVSSEGVISWTNNGDLPNPQSVNVKGADGDDGAAATIAVGTVQTGAAGSSASVTNSGTSSAAVFDFVIPAGANGQDGADGQNGADGAAATITVGTVTTGNAGTNASVTNSGTTSAAVLDFVIPRGDAGQAGYPTIASGDAGKVLKVNASETGVEWGSGGGGGASTWSDISNKPFSTIGSGLTVSNDALSADAQLPSDPSSDGTYYLSSTVSSGSATHAWVSIPAANGVSF